METTNIQSPAATAAAAAAAPAVSPAPIAATPNMPATAGPMLPVLSPGHQSSEFYLALAVVAVIVAALWNGKLDPALASALLGLIVSGYPTLRTWLKAQHVDAVADVLAAHIQNGGGALALGTLAGAVGEAASFPRRGEGSQRLPLQATTPKDAGAMGGQGAVADGNDGTNGMSSRATLAPLLLLGTLLLALNGCAGTPYYVSGINGTVDTSKDGSRISGGEVGVTISPNPNYPPPPAKSDGKTMKPIKSACIPHPVRGLAEVTTKTPGHEGETGGKRAVASSPWHRRRDALQAFVSSRLCGENQP